MPWEVVATQNEETWFDDYVREVIAHDPIQLPDREQHVGHVEVVWYPWDPGTAHIQSSGGTSDDRLLAEAMVEAQLEGHGYKRAVHSLYLDPSTPLEHPNARYATWDDVMAKAKRLIQSGAVQVIRNGANNVVGAVQGDHGNYQPEIQRQDPSNPNAISSSSCQCDWGNFQNTPRTRIWKKFQDRVCSHILALNWMAQAMPTDESRAPGDEGDSGQMSLPMSLGPQGAPSSMPMMQQQPAMPAGPPPGQAPQMPPGGGQPSPQDLLPQFPMDPSMMPQVNPASVPGQKQPSPTNPIQYPGGTFSHVYSDTMPGMDFNEGDRVMLKNEDMGTAVGDHPSAGAGQQVTIPKNSLGEVRGVDPITKMVEIFYTGPQNNNRQLQPWGTSAWHWPSDLIQRPDLPTGINPHVRRSR